CTQATPHAWPPNPTRKVRRPPTRNSRQDSRGLFHPPKRQQTPPAYGAAFAIGTTAAGSRAAGATDRLVDRPGALIAGRHAPRRRVGIAARFAGGGHVAARPLAALRRLPRLHRDESQRFVRRVKHLVRRQILTEHAQ